MSTQPKNIVITTAATATASTISTDTQRLADRLAEAEKNKRILEYVAANPKPKKTVRFTASTATGEGTEIGYKLSAIKNAPLLPFKNTGIPASTDVIAKLNSEQSQSRQAQLAAWAKLSNKERTDLSKNKKDEIVNNICAEAKNTQVYTSYLLGKLFRDFMPDSELFSTAVRDYVNDPEKISQRSTMGSILLKFIKELKLPFLKQPREQHKVTTIVQSTASTGIPAPTDVNVKLNSEQSESRQARLATWAKLTTKERQDLTKDKKDQIAQDLCAEAKNTYTYKSYNHKARSLFSNFLVVASSYVNDPENQKTIGGSYYSILFDCIDNLKLPIPQQLQEQRKAAAANNNRLYK